MTRLNRDQLVALARSQIIETSAEDLSQRMKNGTRWPPS